MKQLGTLVLGPDLMRTVNTLRTRQLRGRVMALLSQDPPPHISVVPARAPPVPIPAALHPPPTQ
jgi:hypothetical protein